MAVIQEHPTVVRYGVLADAAWRTREVHVAVRAGGPEKVLHLLADGEGMWTGNGERMPALDGCLDVDLEITPSTNTLPIRRLNLPVGAGADVPAVRVCFPDLGVERSEQRYRHVEHGTYHRAGPLFQADLQTDDLGLVTRYGGRWERSGSVDGQAT